MAEEFVFPNSRFFPEDTPDQSRGAVRTRLVVCDELILYAPASVTTTEAGRVEEYRRVLVFRNEAEDKAFWSNETAPRLISVDSGGLRDEDLPSDAEEKREEDGDPLRLNRTRSGDSEVDGAVVPSGVAGRRRSARGSASAASQSSASKALAPPDSPKTEVLSEAQHKPIAGEDRSASPVHVSVQTKAEEDEDRRTSMVGNLPVHSSSHRMLTHTYKHLQTVRTSVGSNISVIGAAGTHVITGHENGLVCTWNMKTGEMRHSIRAHTAPVEVVWVNNGLLFTGAMGGHLPLRAFNLNSGRHHANFGPSNIECFPRTKRTSSFRNKPTDVLPAQQTMKLWDPAISRQSPKERPLLTGLSKEERRRGIRVTTLMVHTESEGDGDGHMWAGFSDGTVRVFMVDQLTLEQEYRYGNPEIIDYTESVAVKVESDAANAAAKPAPAEPSVSGEHSESKAAAASPPMKAAQPAKEGDVGTPTSTTSGHTTTVVVKPSKRGMVTFPSTDQSSTSPVTQIVIYDGSVAAPPTVSVVYMNGRLNVWNREVNGVVVQLNKVSCVDLAYPDTLFVGGTDGTLRMVDLNEGTIIKSVQVHDVRVTHMNSHEDRALFGFQDGKLVLWDSVNQTTVREFHVDESGLGDMKTQRGVAFHASKSANDLSSTMYRTGAHLGEYEIKTDSVLRLRPHTLKNGTKVLFSATALGVVTMWDRDTKAIARQFDKQLPAPCTGLYVLDDVLYASSSKGTLAWNLSTGISVSLGDSASTAFFDAQAATNRVVAGGRAYVRAVDSEHVAAYDVGTWKLRHRYACPKATRIAVGDRAIAVADSDGKVLMFDMATTKETHNLPIVHDYVGAMEVSDDGYLYVACIGGIIRAFDFDKGDEMQSFRCASTRSVTSMNIHKGTLYSGGLDSTVRIWDVGTSRLVLQFPLWHCDPVNSIVLDTDETGVDHHGARPRTLITASTEIVTLDLASTKGMEIPVTHLYGEESKTQVLRSTYGKHADLVAQVLFYILDIVQLIGLALWPTVKWDDSGSAGEFAEWIVAFGVWGKDFVGLFVLAAVAVVLFTSIIAWQEQVEALIFLNPNRPLFVVLWNSLSFYCKMMARPFSATILLCIVSTIDCSEQPDGRWALDSNTDYTCWSTEHVYIVVAALVTLITYVPMMVRFARASYRMANIEATWNLLDWSGDSVARPPRLHPFSHTAESIYHNMVVVVFKAVVAVFLVLQTRRPEVAMSVGLAFSVVTAVLAVLKPPFFQRDEMVNRINCSLSFALIFVYVLALCLTMDWVDRADAFTLGLIGCGSMLLLGAIAAHFTFARGNHATVVKSGHGSDVDFLAVADVEMGAPRRGTPKNSFGRSKVHAKVAGMQEAKATK